MVTLRAPLDSDITLIYRTGREYVKKLGSRTCKDLFTRYLKYGPAVTLVDKDDKPIMILGVVTSEAGVGMAWAFTSTRVESFPIQVIRKVDRWIFNTAIKNQLRRVEALVNVSDMTAVKFAQHIGFTIEGQLRSINPDGTDAFIVGYIVEDFI